MNNQTHTLKTWPIYFDAIANGTKTFEIRLNDRFFQKGDTVVLRRMSANSSTAEYDSFSEELIFIIGDVLTGSNLGLKEGFCIFSLLTYTIPEKDFKTFSSVLLDKR